MAVSIKDVAKKAGVSISTVSRALNGYKDISDETKKRILKIAQEMEYYPNLTAKTLSSKKKCNIAIILSGLLDDLSVNNEYNLLLMRGAYQYAFQHNLEIATYAINSELQEQKSYEQFCKEHSLSGALLYGLKTTDSYCNSLPNSTLPCVTVDITVEGDNVGNVVTDDTAAFQELTQYMIDKGHRKFVIVHGRKSAMVSVERLAGAYKALEDNGIELSKERIIYTNFEGEKAYSGVKEYLGKCGKEDVTAFLCMSDITAIGTIRAIKEMGYSVPEDFSVVGFDGIYASKCIVPLLTTVDQNVERKGYCAAKLLNEMLSKETEKKRIVVEHSIHYRDSIKRIEQ